MSNPSAATTIDDALYVPAQSIAASGPDRLATVATLFGMCPQPIDRARVLEIAPGIGSNLLPLAERYPHSVFVGLDDRQPHLAAARRLADHFGLANVEFRQARLVDVAAEIGRFDYVIAHRVYSWVPRGIQDQLLALIKRVLAPQGVAYVHYHTHPGWIVPSIVRHLVRGAAANTAPLARRVAEAQRALSQFAATLASGAGPHVQSLKVEIDRALAAPEEIFAQDYLSEHNSPVYFHEFIQHAASHGLQYLGDSLLPTMFAGELNLQAQERLKALAPDGISIEQHIDLVHNRASRMTLVCHDDVTMRYPDRESLQRLYFAGRFEPQNPDADERSAVEERFTTTLGSVMASSLPVIKAAARELGAIWPGSLTVDQLVDRVGHRTNGTSSISADEQEVLEHHLATWLIAGLIEARTQADSFVTVPGERPRAAALARWQARGTSPVTNRRHETVQLDEVSQNLLVHLDGQRNRAELVELLVQASEQGQLSILAGGVPLGQDQVATNELWMQVLDQILIRLASRALLIG
ncbi:MAG TPA: class I SAM-dependent methyltransferase [Pirellulales bacterium]|nr:class I SAM-dependent methyltransferase [Pirellulales bacterium]